MPLMWRGANGETYTNLRDSSSGLLERRAQKARENERLMKRHVPQYRLVQSPSGSSRLLPLHPSTVLWPVLDGTKIRATCHLPWAAGRPARQHTAGPSARTLQASSPRAFHLRQRRVENELHQPQALAQARCIGRGKHGHACGFTCEKPAGECKCWGALLAQLLLYAV